MFPVIFWIPDTLGEGMFQRLGGNTGLQGISSVIYLIPNTLGDLVRVSPVISWILNTLGDLVRCMFQRLGGNVVYLLDLNIVPIFGSIV